MEMNHTENVLSSLGEVKGMLHGVTDMIRQSNESTNKRIDDLSRSITRRMDDHDSRLTAVGEKADEAMQVATSVEARIGRNSAMLGGGAGVLMAAAVEFIKLKWLR